MADLRIILLGKTGAGKSSLGNTILRENVFENGFAISETAKCQTKTRRVNGRRITLIDTPGFFDTNRSDEELKSELVKCITECAFGVHTFLIVLRVQRFTEMDNQVIEGIQSQFGDEAFKHAVVVFTHGDELDEKMTIEEFVSQNEKLSDLLKKCRNRCHVIDNKYWRNNHQDEYRNNEVQVEKLLNTIQQMADEEGLYTNEMLQAMESKIKQEKERLRQTGAVEATAAAGAEVGLGIAAGVVAAAVGAAVGGCIGYEEADQADSVSEAVVNPAKAVIDMAKEVVTNKRQRVDKMPLLFDS